MEDYADLPYPSKAGVYAVRAGPIIADNILAYLAEKPLTEYVPQKSFLSLLMTGDGSCIGSRFDLAFGGKWVWKMKDYIDMSFMNLFNPRFLFENYEEQGTAKPLPNFGLFEDSSDD